MKGENMGYLFKIADRDWEFEQIYELNYDSFVEEIPQHEPNPDEKLIDKFHEENIYIICLKEKTLAGMLCIRTQRPFSLDKKLDNLDSYLPEHESVCEIRLFTVNRKYRGSKIALGLMLEMGNYAVAHRHDLALISGSVRQQKLYRRVGFVPFGPLTGKEGALFQPMYITRETFLKFKKQQVCS